MKPKIILISGTAGVGKTSIAKAIVKEFNITHRIGTGFIREVTRAYTNKNNVPELFNYTFTNSKKQDFFNNYLTQCKFLRPAIKRIISRAKKEGTSIVIEGNHLLPKYFAKDKYVYFVLLTLDDEKELFKRLNSDTHSKRKVTKSNLECILKIQEFLKSSAFENNVKIIYNSSIDNTLKKIKTILK